MARAIVSSKLATPRKLKRDDHAQTLDHVGPQAPPTRGPPSARLRGTSPRTRDPPVDYVDKLPNQLRALYKTAELAPCSTAVDS